MENKGVAVVTGGGRGIGLAIAQRLVQEDYDVVITLRQSLTDEQAAALSAQGLRWVYGDVTREAEAQQMISEAISSDKRLMALINNAGVTQDKLMTRMSLDDFNRVVTTNLTGTFNMTKVALKHMQRQRAGSIVDISSVVGLTGNIGQANYAASKAGIIGLMKTTAKEGGLRNVRCNAIAPGMVATAMTEALSEKVRDQLQAAIPLKRFATPAEIADAVAFLLENDYMTGQTLTIDGGLTL